MSELSASKVADDPALGWTLAAARVTVAFLWMSGAGWKVPPHFGENSGRGLFKYVSYGADYPVFAPYAWLVESVILPNLQVFGWLTLLTEASLGAFLLVGLATRFWAAVGIIQSVTIALSVLFAPHEWPWAYYLMVLAHVVLLASAAGRAHGLDGLFRDRWQASERPLARLMLRVS